MNIRDRIVELRKVPASQVKPSPRNWRTHPKEQADALRGILADVGFAGAVLARTLADGSLEAIDGHLRLETMGGEEVPVLVTDLTEEEANLVLATHDPLGAMAETNTKALDELLHGLTPQNDAVIAMIEDMAKNAGLEWGDVEPGAGGDEFDATPEEGPTRTNPGELWVIGGKHRLLVGDCTKAENVKRLMDGANPHLMVTDPPYGVAYDANWRNEASRADGTAIGGSAIGKVANDDQADWTEAWRNFPGDVAYVWHAGRYSSTVQTSLESIGLIARCQIIWAKNNFAIGRGDYHWKHEPCWYVVREGKAGHYNGSRSETTLWEINKPQKSETGHSTQKPIECMSKPIENNSLPGEIVYDPFLGSGTTLIAAHRLGRICYGCELEPKYADVIIKRAEAEGLTCEKVG